MSLVSGTEYSISGVEISDVDYIAIGSVIPTIDHTLALGSGAESDDAIIEILSDSADEKSMDDYSSESDGSDAFCVRASKHA